VAGVNADADAARDKTATKENFIVNVQCRLCNRVNNLLRITISEQVKIETVNFLLLAIYLFLDRKSTGPSTQKKKRIATSREDIFYGDGLSIIRHKMMPVNSLHANLHSNIRLLMFYSRTSYEANS